MRYQHENYIRYPCLLSHIENLEEKNNFICKLSHGIEKNESSWHYWGKAPL